MNLTEKIIDYKDLGKITLRKSSTAKNLSISVRPFKGTRVTVPANVSFNRAEKFIEEKESWLRKTILNIKTAENNFTVFNYNSSFHTVDHVLEILKINEGNPRVKLSEGKIQVCCPGNRDINDKKIQEMIRCGIEAAWNKEAKRYLPARLGELARLHGFVFRKVVIKNNRSRWGSCSHQNNINLSLQIMRLPRQLSDYVLLHELVHTVHKNHSREFWKHLDKLTGNAKILDRQLRQYRIDIY